MTISVQELGQRLREAREACGLTQDQVGGKLGLSRATVAQMELGNRQVTSLELDRLAYMYGRDIRSFLSDRFDTQDALTVLFRANPELASNEEVAESLRHCIAIGRELSNLEELLGIERDYLVPAVYPLGTPKNKWGAIKEGENFAVKERKRLELGDAPILDMAEIIEYQGVRTAVISLPKDVSGLTIHDPGMGVLVVINKTHGVMRQRFSLAHEYGHVLLDRDRQVSTISRGSNRNEMPEVRANSFAASLLMPEQGIRRFMAGLGKGRQSRGVADVYDEEAIVRAQMRAKPRSQDIQIYDLARLSASFGVSAIAALFRLQNLGLVSDGRRRKLQRDIEIGMEKEVAKIMELPKFGGRMIRSEFKRRFLGLAMEAYRREHISKSKFRELADMVNVPVDTLTNLIEDAGIEDE